MGQNPAKIKKTKKTKDSWHYHGAEPSKNHKNHTDTHTHTHRHTHTHTPECYGEWINYCITYAQRHKYYRHNHRHTDTQTQVHHNKELRQVTQTPIKK